MSSLAADVAFDFTFPPCDPATPPPPAASNTFSYDASSLLEIPFHHGYGSGHGHGHGHARSSSQCSAYSAYSVNSVNSVNSAASAYSFASSTPSDAFLHTPAVSTASSTRHSTPARSPIRTHGPLLLPKIRSQDQALGPADAVHAPAPPRRSRTSPAPATSFRSEARGRSAAKTTSSRRRSTAVTPAKQPYAASDASASRHVRSFTNPDSVLVFGMSRSFSADDVQPQPQPLSLSLSLSLSQSQQASFGRAVTPVSVFESTPPPPTLLCSPASFVTQSQLSQDGQQAQRRASVCSLDGGVSTVNAGADYEDAKYDYEYGFAPYPGTVPTGYMASSADGLTHEEAYIYHGFPQEQLQQQQSYAPRAHSPLSVESTSASCTPEPVAAMPEPLTIPVMPVPVITATPPSATTEGPAPVAVTGPTSTLATYLTGANPAPALVRTISFPLRDPNTKHYWWDVRQVRPWAAFTAANLVALPGAAAVLTCPVPVAVLPPPHMPTSARNMHPETESELHGLYAAHYLPRVNAALALSSPRPLQLAAVAASGGGPPTPGSYGDFFVAHAAGDSAPAAALFGGKPTARVVGLVKSFDRFNTGMRAEGNVKRVEYLRGLAHLHFLMREHSCRYGFLLTEIELIVVRNGTEATPHFGQLEVTCVPLAAVANPSRTGVDGEGLAGTPLTACLALWGLCMLASDEMAAAAAAAAPAPTVSALLCPYHMHVGAPAEGTRRKAAPRDSWMPAPQLAEKRTAKRARGWVLPEDAIGRKEMGRRGVRYNGAH